MNLTLFSEVANKFNAFDRQDKKYIKRWILFPWVWMLTVKTIFGLVWMTMVFLMLKLVTLGHKKNEYQRLRDLRISFATLVFKYGAYGLMFFLFDVCWVSHKKPQVCYKKYLGDSWSAEYRNASTHICNHTSICDPFTLMSLGIFSTYVMREDGVNPFLKPGIDFINCVLVGKDKKAATQLIIEHQQRSEKGEDLPLTIYPEGTTTAGPIIKFQRGAFISETSVQPYVVKYKSPLISPRTGIFDLTLMFFMISPLILFCKVEIIELPTFRPNQFFWDKYWK